MLTNKTIQEDPNMKAAQERLREKQEKEMVERFQKLQKMNRKQRRAISSANKFGKIPGINKDHIKPR